MLNGSMMSLVSRDCRSGFRGIPGINTPSHERIGTWDAKWPKAGAVEFAASQVAEERAA